MSCSSSTRLSCFLDWLIPDGLGYAGVTISSQQYTSRNHCRYLNTADYFGGLDEEDLDQLFHAMQSNFKAWVSGFTPLALGADIDSMAVQEFSRTLFNIRPDIAFNVAKTIFTSDLRSILHQVFPALPCTMHKCWDV